MWEIGQLSWRLVRYYNYYSQDNGFECYLLYLLGTCMQAHTLYTPYIIPVLQYLYVYKHTNHLLTIIIQYAHTHAHVQSLQSFHNYACTLQLVLFISSRLMGIAQNNFKAELVVSILPNLYTTKSNLNKLLSVL